MKRCLECDTCFDNHLWQCPSCHWRARVINGFAAFAPELAEGGAGFSAEAFAALAQVEEGSFWFRSRNQLILWALRTYFPEIHSFFEVGCGTGFVLSGVAAANPEIRLVGSEVFAEGLRFAGRRLPTAELMQMDARNIPFADEFDAIGIFDVLEHIKEDERVLGQIFQALRPGGGLLITVPQHMFLWSAVDETSCHVRRYAAADLRAKVKRAGFRLLRSTSFVSLLLPAMLVVRRKNKNYRNLNELCGLQLPKMLDSMLRFVMHCELLAIRFGCSYPAGGSLLLIAKKPSSSLEKARYICCE